MASSSTASVEKSFKYEVFISFRGDLRLNFVDHLFDALQLKNKIYTYKDDVRMNKGKLIADDLTESIKESKFHIIVFSKNYPSSRWCLNELVEIMKCQKETGYKALPVFYNVEPSEVDNQTGDFGKAFDKLKEKMTFERYHKKVAFAEATDDLRKKKDVESNLKWTFGKAFDEPENENDKKEKEKKAFEEWKEKAVEEWKMALKGAVSLAGLELKKTADGREASFIRAIVELVLLELRSTHLSTDEKLVGMGSRIEEVLSTLGTGSDDVRMIGIKGMGGAGKTTLARAVFDRISLQFKGKSFVENIREVSNEPSSGLKSLQNQVLSDVLHDQGMSVSSVYDGKNTLKRMMGGKKVLLVLDDVDHVEQLEALAGELSWFKPGSRIIITTRDEHVLIAHSVKLILNVSLLLNNEAICLFSRYAFGKELPIQGYEELSQKVVSYASGLPLTIRVLGSFLCGKNDTEWMDAIERLKTIPLKETLKKLELSYTCLDDDYKEIFLDVACMMKGWPLQDAIDALESRGFHAKIGLRVLEQKSLITIDKCVRMHDHIEEMGRDIVRRCYRDTPNRHSRLWIEEEIKDIIVNDLGTEATRCIRFFTIKVDLETVMKGLRKMADIRFLYLYLGMNFDDKGYDDMSLYFPDSLNFLYCMGYPFSYLPATFKANNLVVLRMPFNKINQLWEGKNQKVLHKLRVLDLYLSSIRTLDLRLTPHLETLTLEGCDELTELHMPIACPRLRSLHLEKFREGTYHLGLAPNLETLTLGSYGGYVELYMPVELLKLRSFKVNGSRLSMLDLGLTPNLEHLELHDCYNLVEVRVPDNCLNLTFLKITNSNLRTLKIGLTSNLIALDLQKCPYMEELHIAGECLKLEILGIYDSKMTTLDLGLTPNLKKLKLEDCFDLVQLHPPIGCLKNLVLLSLSGCLGYETICFEINDNTSSRVNESHEVSPVAELSVYPDVCPFHPDYNLPMFDYKSFSKEDLPSLTTSLERLISKGPCSCVKLKKFSKSINALQLKACISFRDFQGS